MEDFKKGDRYCANGHCGASGTESGTAESVALRDIFRILWVRRIDVGVVNEFTRFQFSNIAAAVNDGSTMKYRQPTPKQRIIAALYDIKRMQQVEISDPPVTVEDLIGNEIFQGQPLNG